MFNNGITVIECLSYLLFNSLCILGLQKYILVSIYTVLLLFTLFVGIDFEKTSSEILQFLYGGIFSMNAFGILVYYSRNKQESSILDFSEYLSKYVNQKGRGYVLFKLAHNLQEVVDMSSEVQELLEIDGEKYEIQDQFFRIFTFEEQIDLIKLKLGSYYQKYYTFTNKTGVKKSIRIDVNVLVINNDSYLQAIAMDATEFFEIEKEKANNERMYKNLYERNLAGVFTLDKDSKIVACNPSFFEVLDNQLAIEDYLFTGRQMQIWEEISTLVEVNRNLKNYQIDYLLPNGNLKILIFNIYYDRELQKLQGTVIDGTDLQKATSALEQSEQKFRLLFQDSNDAIFLLEEDKIISANRKALQIFGLTEHDLFQKSLWDLSKNTTDLARNEYDRYFRKLDKNNRVRFPWHFGKNNQTVDAEVNITRIKVGNDIINQCLLHDNTERNKNINNLQRSQQSFKSIIENTPEGFLILTKESCVYANPEALKLLKISQNQTNEINFQTLFLGEDQYRFDTALSQHRKSKETIRKEFILKQKDIKETTKVEVSFVTTNYQNEESVLLILKDLTVFTNLNKETVRAEVAEDMTRRLESEVKERIKIEKLLVEQNLRNKAINDSSSNTFMMTLNTKFLVTEFNTHTEKLINYTINHDIELNESINSVFGNVYDDNQLRYFKKVLRKVLKGESIQIETLMKYDEDRELWLEMFLNPIVDSKGIVTEISLVSHDITAKKQNQEEMLRSLKEKEVLLKEIHHRVKNNLQVISSILNLQSSFVDDPKILDVLEESRNRIRSMAVIHENLYKTTNFSSINLASYILNLSKNLLSSYQIYGNSVKLETELVEVELALDQAVPCGLIINELITNALKYAFPNGAEGVIEIKLSEEGDRVNLWIEDNGIGLPEGFDYRESDSLGLQLVVTLVEQLDGEVTLSSESGTKYFITFVKLKP